MRCSARRDARAGADFLICADNTIHQGLPWVIRRSPLPWLHIAEVVAAQAAELGFRRLGILGTRYLVDGEVYPEKRSEEHTSELQSQSNLVCRLLLEKKKHNNALHNHIQAGVPTQRTLPGPKLRRHYSLLY